MITDTIAPTNLWTVTEDGRLRAVGHTAAKSQVGDYVLSDDGVLYRVIADPLRDMRWWPISVPRIGSASSASTTDGPPATG